MAPRIAAARLSCSGAACPPTRRFGVVAGTGRILEALERFEFDAEQIEWLRDQGIISEEAAQFLASWRFTGDIWGYAEGECYFAGSPLLTVEGTFADCTLLETLLLSILNHDCAVASAASRMTIAAHGRPCMDMGARRAHERALAAIRQQASFGVQYVRTHVDVTDPELTALRALIDLREEIADTITLQIVAFPQEASNPSPTGAN